MNLPVGILCGIGFAIYMLEDMLDPGSDASESVIPPASGGEGPPQAESTSASRSSDSKKSSSSGSSSASRRVLSETEKASLPTSTGKSKDKDKTERLPVSPAGAAITGSKYS